MTQQVSPRDYELLSAYLDGELSERDRARLEARMSKQPELRFGLEELRQTSLLLRSLPSKRAPRNFTIPNALPRRRALPRLYPALSFASALAGILFLIVFIGDYALGMSTQSLASKIPASTSVPAPMLENQVTSDLATTAAAAAPAAPAPDNPPAALVAPLSPTEMTSSGAQNGALAAPTETPSVEPAATQSTVEPFLGFSSQAITGTEQGPATGMGSGVGAEGSPCAETCTPQPTETVAPTSGVDTGEALGGAAPTIGSFAAGSAAGAGTSTPTPIIENTPVPEFTPDISTLSQPGAMDETEPAPGARNFSPIDTPTAEPTLQEQFKSQAEIVPTQTAPESPTQDASSRSMIAEETPTVAPTEPLTLREKLSQPYAQMMVRLAEIGLAGFALLAGLAAIFLRINSRS